MNRICKEVALIRNNDMNYLRVDRVNLNSIRLVNVSNFICNHDRQGCVIGLALEKARELAAAILLAVETEIPGTLRMEQLVAKEPCPRPAPIKTATPRRKPEKKKIPKRKLANVKLFDPETQAG